MDKSKVPRFMAHGVVLRTHNLCIARFSICSESSGVVTEAGTQRGGQLFL